MYMLILNFTYPLRCLRVPPVEYHWSRGFTFGPYQSNTILFYMKLKYIFIKFLKKKADRPRNWYKT
jgi:hypothetical protein